MDRLLSELILKFKKASAEDVRSALKDLRAWHEAGKKGDVCDVLAHRGLISDRTARRLRMLATRQAGPKIPGFEIIEPLGGGGMGVVYKARQVALDRIVALKILAPDVLDDPEAVARFRREARAAGRLDHPNIVKAFDVSTGNPAAGEPPHLVMEFVTGETLHQILTTRDTLSEKQALRIGSAVAAALDHAYRAGLVHRDVKPDNIMITPKGEVKLCDLGLAKLVAGDQSITRPEMTHGTPHFMSPEQAQGKRALDIRSDLYSLGCTLYRIVVGRPPFVANSAMEILLKHISQPAPSVKAARPELSIEFERIVQKLLEKDPAKRYQYPAHLQTDFELVLAGEKPRLDYGVPFRQIQPASSSAELPKIAPLDTTSALEFASNTSDDDAKTVQPTVADEMFRAAQAAAVRNTASGTRRSSKPKTIPPASSSAAAASVTASRPGTQAKPGKKEPPKKRRRRRRGLSGLYGTIAEHLRRDRRWQLGAAAAAVGVVLIVGALVALIVFLPGESSPWPVDPNGPSPNGSAPDNGGNNPPISVETDRLTPDLPTRRAWLEAAQQAEAARLDALEAAARADRARIVTAFDDLRTPR